MGAVEESLDLFEVDTDGKVEPLPKSEPKLSGGVEAGLSAEEELCDNPPKPANTGFFGSSPEVSASPCATLTEGLGLTEKNPLAF